MESEGSTSKNSKAMTIAGWVIGGLPALMMVATSPMAILKLPQAVEGMKTYGYPDSSMMPLGIAELISGILYLVPQTSVLGAILITGYLGGATATHVRAGEANFFVPIVMGVLFWAGLWLRFPTLRSILPIKKK